jgi:DNA (cytosine-5)-methyltransferase 1
MRSGDVIFVTFGSLFAGIGGFDLGFERAGMECCWQVEIDPFCRRVLAKHWPDVRRHDDVRTFPPSQPEAWTVDCIVGGFPCKQTSVAASVHGRRSGLDGKDSGLWWQMHRVVQCLRPEIVVVENVAGASAWQDAIAGSLEESGYCVGQLRVAADEFTAPHGRRRIIFVADADGERFSRTWQGRSQEIEGGERRAVAGNHWDAGSGEFRRMADGISGRVDRRKRIERLGNAVVPQVAEWIGRRIMESR